MNRRERTEILIEGSPQLAHRLAQSIEEKYQVKVVEGPRQVLVMIKAREGANQSLFYLGEVLATEAKVQVEQALGLGVAIGGPEALAYDLAVVDGAYTAGLPETAAWEPLLQAEKARLWQKRQTERRRLEQTRVNFQTMEEELL